MKKLGFLGILLFILLISCVDFDLPRVNGMWQLKSITDENGNRQTVDTIYYSFERQALFSYTILNAAPSQPDPTIIVYGYVDFPAKDKLHILVDSQYSGSFTFWDSQEVTYDILKLNSKELILGWEGFTYHFIKF